ncbi:MULTISPECIES: flagellar export protein FliJ [Pseudomonas]|jgi:flagellar FliJ protein|uniref:Flagellar FliJ protein n=1 Tax=Serpens gallinarum TaxID=2763075 RepID=A0ABR8TRF1_9PSED|nr:flagellar export protein FliJ [Serpens gallinarum]MBD7978335.1 flagella biosynthesis chaperone FliJ [Serpens gallinarum]
MSQRRAERLAPVVDMATETEREAARQLGRSLQQLQNSENQLVELRRYLGDYQQQWLTAGGQGVSGQWLINYQRFLTQLDSAIGQQQRSVEWNQENVRKAREQWQKCYARLEGLRKLVQRYLDEARAAAEKREQKLLDELAQRLRPQSV